MNDIGDKIGAMVAAFISLAVIAIVISNAANTTNVITAFFGGVSNLIGVAISPVTGQNASTTGLGGGLWAGGSQTGSFATATNASNAGGFVGSLLGSSGSLIGGLLGGSGNSGGNGLTDTQWLSSMGL